MKILVIGGTGLVGSKFIEVNRGRFEIESPSSSELNVLDPQKIENYLKNSSCEVVLNSSGYTKVDDAEDQKDDLNGDCYKLNVEAAQSLAKACKEFGKHLVHISTDYVFDGTKKESPYTEEDKPNPVSWYAKTKLMGDRRVLEYAVHYTIARPEMPYSTNYTRKSDFARFFYHSLKEGKSFKAVTDQKITPIFVDDLAKALGVLAENKFEGIINVASTDFITPFEFAQKIAEGIGADKGLIEGVKFTDFNKDRKALRPQHSWLDVSKFKKEFGEGVLKSNDEEIKEFLKELI